MFNYPQQVKEFINENFVPVNEPSLAEYKFTTDQLLSFLFCTFPDGCINDYDLNDILLSLGFKSTVFKQKIITKTEKGKDVESVTLHNLWLFCSKKIFQTL